MAQYYEIARIHGMCGGVFNALDTIEKKLADCSGQNLYVLHELVHNKLVTSQLESRGVIFVDSPENVPPGAPLVIGAHGVSAAVRKKLEMRTSDITDTTCPLVKKLQNFAAALNKNEQLIIFGKAGHPEVSGVCGHSNAGKTIVISSAGEISSLPPLSAPHYISQTTVDAVQADEIAEKLREKYPHIDLMTGVCHASRERQQAIPDLASRCDLILVIGSAHSSNANRLRELAEQSGAKAFLIDNHTDIPQKEIASASRIGLTSGASTPECILLNVAETLEKSGFILDKSCYQ